MARIHTPQERVCVVINREGVQSPYVWSIARRSAVGFARRVVRNHPDMTFVGIVRLK